MKYFAILLVVTFTSIGLAQEAPADTQNHTSPLTLAGNLLEHDFVNFYAFGNFVYDEEGITQSEDLNSAGEEFGGGVSAVHSFRNGILSLSYRGAYRHYDNSSLGSGTDQNLSFAISKQLNRRWGISFYQAAGVYLYGGTYFGVEPEGSALVGTNPFSPETRFLNSGLTVSYQQTQRLSYNFSGDFFLNRYNYAGAIGTTGTSGTANAQYRVTRRTTLGGGYTRSYYVYQRGSGTLQADNFFLTLSHQFGSKWNASLSGGATRTHNEGSIPIPVSFITNGQVETGYVIGRYNESTIFPSFSGTLTHNMRRTQLSISGGQGINPGNGFFLASRSEYLSGFFSYSTRGSSLGFGGSYSRYTSISNTVSSAFNTTSFSASYSKVLTRYFGTSASYNLVYYPQFGGRSDNRFSVGIFFTTKSIPITLF